MENNSSNFDLEFKEAVVEADHSDSTDPVVEPVIPEKYSGKSVDEIIKMHLNAEKKISEQGQTIGELRKLADDLIGLKKTNEEPPKPVTSDELFTDPDSAVRRVVDNSELAKRANETLERVDRIEKSIGQSDFESRHPTFMQDVQDPEFQKWVQGNKARMNLLLGLHNYNFEAGSSLWEMWDEYKSLKPQAEEARKKTVKQASTVKSGPAEKAVKPTYSRVKLMELQSKVLRGDPIAKSQWFDPKFQKEYQDAYKEGRIKD